MISEKGPYLQNILEKIKEERNLDFSQYRENLLSRRVMARVRSTKTGGFEQYYYYLKLHPEEIDNLMDVMTINVTEFFRDTPVFDAIEKNVIPELISKKKMGSNPVRVWSCACSSGEEAYSVLMLFAEILNKEIANYGLTIFGTDIDNRVLAKAKEGVYEDCQFKNLSAQKKSLINKYFYDIGNKRYWIREGWPDYMKFYYNDIIADVPLKNMDMILCRNVFIYFSRKLQEHILERLLSSLNKGGFLILGRVESIPVHMTDRFIEYDSKNRIYVKK
ncbi:MAG: protein-glutamate O-methyltransferase CheR [bacterium]|nr:protein-glutamate O-methyltransferase CheR [bacterium]